MDLEELALKLGFDKLPKEEQNVFMDQIVDMLHRRIGLHYAEHMTEEEMTKFNELAEHDPQSALDYLEESYPDYEEVVRAEIAELAEEVQAMMPPQK